jgi:hypothetical protein
MKIVTGQTLAEAELTGLLTETELVDCFFDNCVALGAAPTPSSRPVIRNVTLRGCRQRASALHGALLENVLVEGLGREGRDPLFVWAPAFRHVTLRGSVAAPKFNVTVGLTGRSSASWVSANRDFYRDVDWALDISEARLSGSVNLEAVPGHLVRRNPETQVLVYRPRASGVDLGQLGLPDPSVGLAIEWFLQDGPFDSVVVAAPTDARYFRDALASLRVLREAGIAEDD